MKKTKKCTLTLQVRRNYSSLSETSTLEILVALFRISAGIEFRDADAATHHHAVRPEIHTEPGWERGERRENAFITEAEEFFTFPGSCDRPSDPVAE